MDENNGNSGWELSKENIQPLSSGRKVSILKHSLDTSKNMIDYEIEMEHQNKMFEDKIKSYNGDDPLGTWVEYIQFLENSCLLVTKLKKQLNITIKLCVKTFLKDPLYMNDKRYIEIYAKLIQELSVEKRIAILTKSLETDGIGSKVTEMYLFIAELQESLGKTTEARKTIKEGIKKQAHPLDKLEDALKQIEYRIAESLAKTFNQKQGAINDGNRYFGSEVPIFGPKGDAPSIRKDLEPAIPVHVATHGTIKQIGKKPLELFKGGLENAPILSSSKNSIVDPPRSALDVLESESKKTTDKENKLAPSKWNCSELVIEPEDHVSSGLFDPLPERIQLYVDHDEPELKLPKCVSIQSGILKERKEISSPILPDDIIVKPPYEKGLFGTTHQPQQVQNLPLPQSAQTGTGSTVSSTQIANNTNKLNFVARKAIMMDGKEVSFEHKRRKLWLENYKKTQTVENISAQLRESISKLEKAEQKLNEVYKTNEELQSRLDKEELLSQERASKIQDLQDDLNKLTTENEHLNADFDLQDRRIKEFCIQLSAERYRCQELADALEEEKNKNVELFAALEEERKKSAEIAVALEEEKAKITSASSSANSAPSSSSTLVGSTPSVSNASIAGAIGDNSQNAENNPPSSEFSFLPSAVVTSSNTNPGRRYSNAPPPLSSNHETFNASVKMGTTYFLKEETAGFPIFESFKEEKKPFKEDVDKDDADTLFIPQRFSKKLPFNLYESCTESQSQLSIYSNTNTKNAPVGSRPNAQICAQVVQPAAMAQENVPPPSFIVPKEPVGSAQIVAKSNNVDINMSMIEGGPYNQYETERNFDVADLTRALQFHPEPLLNSTPERIPNNYGNDFNENRGNFIHTQKIKPLFPADEEQDGPMSPENLRIASYKSQQMEISRIGNLNLSPIQETSKENRSSCTTGSSSGNMTSTRGGTSSGASLYNSTRSVSGGPRSVSRNNPYNYM